MGCLTLVVAAMLGGAPEGNARLDAARAHVSAAFAYFEEERYADAVREIESAYALHPVPELQYNLAQCDERLGKLGSARAAYQAYLDAAPLARDHAEVAARLAQLAGAQDAVTASAPPPPPVERVVLKTIVIYREPPPPPGRAARYAGYGAAVLAVAGAGTAVVAGVLAQKDVQTVTQGGNVASPPLYAGATRSSANEAQQLWQTCGIGIGAAVAFTGAAVALTWMANRVDREAPQVTLAPWVGPAGGGLTALARF